MHLKTDSDPETGKDYPVEWIIIDPEGFTGNACSLWHALWQRGTLYGTQGTLALEHSAMETPKYLGIWHPGTHPTRPGATQIQDRETRCWWGW